MCRYFDKETVGLDFEGMKKDIQAAPESSIVRLASPPFAEARAKG